MRLFSILNITLLLVVFFTVSCEKKVTEYIEIEPEYKVGQTGPANGIIFYDKGKLAEDWRYLEAAPASTELNAEWGAYKHAVEGTSRKLGTGKENTKIIVDFLTSISETGKAAQLCNALSFGDKYDWFLPSQDEIMFLYLNIGANDLGGFSPTLYWTSSQDISSDSLALYHDFDNGGQNNHLKNSALRVRAIRSF